jgi:acyl-CoA thioester hydrolase
LQVGGEEKYSCVSPVQAIELVLQLTYHMRQLKRPFMSEAIFTYSVRVYYEDTDAGGIVYYANYLKFFERARTEWLRAMGIEQDLLLSQNVGFVVTQVLMDNTKAAKFNELLTVTSQISTLKQASIVFVQKIHNIAGDLICSAQIKVACIAMQEMKARAIPAAVTEVLIRVR